MNSATAVLEQPPAEAATTRTETVPPPRRPQRRRNRRHDFTGYAFVLPALAILVAFSVFPILYSFVLSVFSWDMLTSGPRFVGLDNYSDLLTSGELYRSLSLTAVYTIITVGPSMALGLIFAVLLDQNINAISVYRSFFFAPLMTSTVAISVVWLWIYHPDYGLMNEALGFLGASPVKWLNDPNTALLALAIMSVWKNIGFCVVLYLAGLQSIAPNVVEAATMDGAGFWRVVRSIKVPLLGPTSFLLIILLTIDQFQTFAQVDVMTQGGPAGATTLIVPLLWEHAFELFQMGYASAIAVVLFVIVMLLTLVQMFIVGRRVNYQ
ncbi:carbohydrate ABC transporter permease [Cryobacterium sp. Y50]|uniref:carbohydrate ABC transporter permease n=1 Tax=Cryobacterium sp. Y50 TaxID=2048286 RepID=UPI0011B09DCE|nr:sugar ABC transporter permease [Cryobacterium sp. Y50]